MPLALVRHWTKKPRGGVSIGKEWWLFWERGVLPVPLCMLCVRLDFLSCGLSIALRSELSLWVLFGAKGMRRALGLFIPTMR